MEHAASGVSLGLSSAEATARRLAGQGNDYRSPTSRTYLEIVRNNTYPLINGQTLRISIPLSLGVVAVALPVYATALFNGASPDFARTMLTTVASFMGIGALVLIPVAADVEGRVRMPAWMRTVLLVGALAAVYLAVLSTGPGRAFFQLGRCPPRSSSSSAFSPVPGPGPWCTSTARGSSGEPSTS